MRRVLYVALTLHVVSSSQLPAQGRQRCMLAGSQAVLLESQFRIIEHPLGIQQFIGQEAAALTRLFGVAPRLYHFEGDYNAYASFRTEPGLGQGTVYYGSELIAGELEDENRSWASIAGVLGHEYAHIAQFAKNEPQDELQSELHADYLAGFYLARRAHELPGGVERFAHTLFLFGDKGFDFFNPIGHGTGDQRVAALLAGYYAANQDRNLAFRHAFPRGLEFVRQLIPGFRDMGSGLQEIHASAHNSEAFAGLRLVRGSYTLDSDAQKRSVHFRYSYRNDTDRELVVKLIVNSMVVPVDGQGEEGEPRILTQRRMQHRIAPGRVVEFRGEIPSTSQTQSIRVNLETDLVVAFEGDLIASPLPAPQPASR